MATSYTKLSNVIGAPFSEAVLKQLYIRAAHNSTINRSNEEVLFLANKTGWARLVSSVNITLSSDQLKNYYTTLGMVGDAALNKNEDTLAKNWILEAGTAIQGSGDGITLRQGIGPDGAYGLGGTEELGYRPMPGLTSVQIETTGRLGSLRQATISFKVWNMNQLNVIEALYFRLGYSMLLEWGHTQYYQNQTNTLKTDGIYGIDDPFAANLRKEGVQQAIARKAISTSGNYDGMLGIVSNFTWAFNQEGGYDCTVRLIGLGAIMDSTRINQTYKLPDGAIEEFKKNQSAIQLAVEAAEIKRQREEDDKRQKELEASQGTTNLPALPNSPQELYELAKTYDNYPKENTFQDFQNAYGNYAFTNIENTPYPLVKVDYYIPFNKSTKPQFKGALMIKYGGLWINHSEFIKIPLTGANINFDVLLFARFSEQVDIVIDGKDKKGSDIVSEAETSIGKVFDYITADYKPRDEVPLAAKAYAVVGGLLGRRDLAAVVTSDPGTVGVPIDRPMSPTTREIEYLIEQVKAEPSVTTSQKWVSKRVYRYEKNNVGNNVREEGRMETITNRKEDKKGIDMYVRLQITAGEDPAYVPTRRQLIKALDSWMLQSNHTLSGTTISQPGPNDVEVSGQFKTPIENVKYSGGDADLAIARNQNPSLLKTVNVTWKITTNNTGFILGLGTPDPNNLTTAQATSEPNSGDENGTDNQAAPNPVESAVTYQSALHTMLVVVQTQGQAEALNISQTTGVLEVDIQKTTESFYNDGSLNGIFGAKPAVADNSNGVPFNLLQYGLKGYNSNLMYDSKLFDIIPDVNFKDLCKAYVIKYTQGGAEGTQDMIHSPVYIRFGYLLAFLNNMCLIYDSTEKKGSAGSTANNEKHPYIYIDFNPETNFCLTSPQQFSVDPFTCLIPLNASQEEYLSVYPPNIKFSSDNPALNPAKQNIVSNALQKSGLQFKANQEAYQGKTMNILLNIDYLLRIVNEYASSDAQHGVYLQPFLERILTDVNKSLGNMNSFRVAYRDDSNTVQIQDDQWVPSLVLPTGTESSMMSRATYLSTLKSTPTKSGLLPIFGPAPGLVPVAGAQSLARQFQLKTTMSTKLASMIAISAQAQTGSVNATDHSSLSYLNLNKQDRYKKHIQDQSSPESSGKNVNTISKIDGASNDQKVAEMFNEHIKSIYFSLQLSADKIDLAKNYYVERISKTKSNDPVTSAAPFIPADLEMTIDGISGIIMGNAFTVPEDRLPLSLRGENGFTKVAFIVTGLTHTIESNEWLTRIKGQMIKLREDDLQKVRAVTTLITEVQDTFVGAFTAGSELVNTTFVASNAAAKAAAETYLGRSMTDKEFTDLISATFAEASAFQKERAYVAGVILNRARTNKQTIEQVLTRKNQFQSVTGTANNGHQPSPQFRNGPNQSSADSIYGAIVNILSEVPKTYLYFTAANLKAYGPGTNPGYITELAKRGGIVIGQTIFSA
jgi:hypothetical protein